MAEAFLNHLAAERGLAVRGLSAGTASGGSINPLARQVMDEVGISMAGQEQKQLTLEKAQAADRVITMGCGVEADQCPAGMMPTEDWGLDDPAGQPIEAVRVIRDQIRDRVGRMLQEIVVGP